MLKWIRWAGFLLAGACLLFTLQACSSYKPFQYHDERESLPGPGLFSGEDGEFILFRIGNGADQKAVHEKTPEPPTEPDVEKGSTQ